ncbi:thiol-disulfide oxidoreductase [Clostridium gelidum]|uniref:Thiol-disulfide oxidoreductase n=1 Tax=Clostridium gelidum TaxID=704125 RepID=A0ABM7TET3_9CLOT|nr:TlpA disulfide reductase family protein [Clostridium gelidum]BCZ47373.1 thiol-disulfide oxidoreductase [Clostridium gelidum]
MNNKKSILAILLIVGFVGFLTISYFGYNSLKSKYIEKNISKEIEKNDNVKIEFKDSTKESDKLKAKDFVVYDENLKEVNLSDYKGTPVVLNFWASWCPPCKSEMISFNEMSKKYSKDKVAILMINLTDGQRETMSIASKYIKDNNYNMQVLFDNKMNAANIYNISAIPRTIFIDKDGYIVKDESGAITKEELESQIKLLL